MWNLSRTAPLRQYYQTRWTHPSRHLFDCLLWTLAQLVGTIGLAAVLSVIVVLYRTLLEPEMNGGGHGRSGRAAEFSRDVKKAITGGLLWMKETHKEEPEQVALSFLQEHVLIFS